MQTRVTKKERKEKKKKDQVSQWLATMVMLSTRSTRTHARTHARTFWFSSVRGSAKTERRTVRATKSANDISSMHVNVDTVSRNRLAASANLRMDARCRPL